jgi:hypothetical protein
MSAEKEGGGGGHRVEEAAGRERIFAPRIN